MAKLSHTPQHHSRNSSVEFGIDEGLIVLVFFLWTAVLYHTYKVTLPKVNCRKRKLISQLSLADIRWRSYVWAGLDWRANDENHIGWFYAQVNGSVRAQSSKVNEVVDIIRVEMLAVHGVQAITLRHPTWQGVFWVRTPVNNVKVSKSNLNQL